MKLGMHGHYMGLYNIWYKEQWSQLKDKQTYIQTCLEAYWSVCMEEKNRDYSIIKQAHLEISQN